MTAKGKQKGGEKTAERQSKESRQAATRPQTGGEVDLVGFADGLELLRRRRVRGVLVRVRLQRLRPALHLAGVPTGMERERQQKRPEVFLPRCIFSD